jgi:hypothetical protein
LEVLQTPDVLDLQEQVDLKDPKVRRVVKVLRDRKEIKVQLGLQDFLERLESLDHRELKVLLVPLDLWAQLETTVPLDPLDPLDLPVLHLVQQVPKDFLDQRAPKELKELKEPKDLLESLESLVLRAQL